MGCVLRGKFWLLPAISTPLLARVSFYIAVSITNLVLLHKKKNSILFIFTLTQLAVTTLDNAIRLYSSSQDPSAMSVWVTALLYCHFSVALNVIASCTIIVRFWLLRLQMYRASPQRREIYLTYINMTMESVLSYTTFWDCVAGGTHHEQPTRGCFLHEPGANLGVLEFVLLARMTEPT